MLRWRFTEWREKVDKAFLQVKVRKSEKERNVCIVRIEIAERERDGKFEWVDAFAPSLYCTMATQYLWIVFQLLMGQLCTFTFHWIVMLVIQCTFLYLSFLCSSLSSSNIRDTSWHKQNSALFNAAQLTDSLSFSPHWLRLLSWSLRSSSCSYSYLHPLSFPNHLSLATSSTSELTFINTHRVLTRLLHHFATLALTWVWCEYTHTSKNRNIITSYFNLATLTVNVWHRSCERSTLCDLRVDRSIVFFSFSSPLSLLLLLQTIVSSAVSWHRGQTAHKYHEKKKETFCTLAETTIYQRMHLSRFTGVRVTRCWLEQVNQMFVIYSREVE